MGETSVVEVIESTSEQKVDTVAKAEPIVESMGRSEPSDNGAKIGKGKGKNKNKDDGHLVKQAIELYVRMLGSIDEDNKRN